MSTNESKPLILDASAFIMGLDPLSIKSATYTTPKVIEELRGFSIHLRYSTAIQLKKLEVMSPSLRYINEVKRASSTIGDRLKLSETDLSVLALAFNLRSRGYDPIIVSDDYSIQNVATYLDINYSGLSTIGIKSCIKWMIQCSACRKKFSGNFKGKKCPSCDGEVRRRRLTKIPIKSVHM
ncbi:MAG: hypothetical protein ABIH76_04535 [Candidatus Bathyarchaeota archaeon]